MGSVSLSHYSTCRDQSHPRFSHQDSHTRLLTTSTSVSSDDAVFTEEAASVDLSVRSGSDQGHMSATSFCSRPLPELVFPRRLSFQGQQPHPVPASRRSSAQFQFQERPLPTIPPTPYNNVGHDGRVQNQTTRPVASSSDVQTPAKANNDKCTKFKLVCFLITLCLLSVFASSLSVYTYVAICDFKENYCLPCPDLTRTPTANSQWSYYQLTTKEVDGQEMCCVNSSQGLALLVAQVQHNERMNHVISENMTSAHVGLYANGKDREAASIERMSHYTLLISPRPWLQHLQNVAHDLTTLSILVTGRYFVYSSIHYNLNEYPRACRELQYKTWVHHVYVERGSIDDRPTRALLRSEHTCCLECKEERTSGFTGGVFELLAGDQVFVDVSAPPLVIDSKQTSYLGLFLIDQQ